MEVQVRESRDISASGFTMAGRIRKSAYYIEYFSNGTYTKLCDPNGNWLQLKDVSQWYTVKMVFDISRNTYSVYLMNRDTGELLGQADNIPFYGSCNYINYFAFSSTNILCVDNVWIEEIDINNVCVQGEYYPKINPNRTVTYDYSVIAKDEDNKDFHVSDVIWSLNKQAEGVILDRNTGELSIEPSAKPGIFLINAKNILYPDIERSFLIDIER